MTPEEFLRKAQGTAQVNTQPTPAPTTQSGAMSPEDFLRAAKGEATLPPAPAVSVSELEPTKIPDGFTAPNEPEKKNNWLTAGRGILRQGADSVNTTLTGANKWLMGKEGLIGGPLNELKVMLGIGLQDIGETKKSFGDTFGIEKKSETGQKLMDAGRKVVNSENIADKIHDKYVKDAEIDREFYAKNAEGNKVMEVANKYAPTVVAAVPNMVMAYLTKGGSMLGTTTKGVAQTAQAATAVGADKIAAVLGNAMKRIASDPVTQTSFLQTTGASYSDALADGASADEAAVYSLLNGYLGAMIETGGADDAMGGMEAFPRKLSEAMAGRDKKKVLMDYAKSIVGEAGEEVSQGIVERGLKPMYGKETSILPTEGVENAVIDPRAMAEEAIGGALGAGVLGAPGAIRGVRAANVQNRADQLVPEMNAQPKAETEVEAEIQPEAQESVVEPPVESAVKAEPKRLSDNDFINDVLNGDVSNSKAEKIIADPVLRQAFEEATGKKLEGSKSEQRSIIKEAAERTETQPLQPDSTVKPDTQTEVEAEQPTVEVLKPQESAQPTESVITPPKAETQQNAPESVPATVSEKENVQPPAEPFTYPEGDSNDRERGLSSNLRTDDYTAPEIKEVFEDDPLLYQQLSNNGTLQKAVDIWNTGFDMAKSQVDTALYNAKNGKTITPEIVPLTKIVANELAKQNRVDEAVAMETDLAATLTFYGQITQAARILRHGGTGSVLTAIQKTIDLMNADLKSRTKKGKEPVVITLDEKLVKKYNEQTTDEGRDKVIHEMQKSIAQQMPSTFMERINALRYTNMLGNFKTQIRNVIGNTANLSRIKLSNVLAEMIERASGTERTKSIYAGKQLLSEAAKDFDNVRDDIMGGGKFSDYKRKFGNEIQGERTIFKANGDWGKSVASPAYNVRRATDVLMKGMEGYRKATEFVMDYGDVIFARAAYADALGGWLKAHGYNSMTNVDAETLAKGKAYAIKEAQKATFREDTALTEFMQGMRYKGNNPVKKAASTVGEAIMPFLKTPANVFTQGVEASPIGAIKTVFDIKKLKTGDMSATDFISELSKNITGSALFAVGMWLKAIGKARGTGGDDEEAAEYTKQMGEMDYAVDLNGNGNWSTVDWASPMSLPFFMGVATWDAVESEGLNASTALKALGGINNAMIEMSMLKGLSDTLDDLGSTFKNGGVDVDKFTKLLISASTSYASQLLNNSLYRQAEYASDKTRQTSYSDPNSKLGSELQYPVSKLTRGLPGDYNMQEYLDAWGRPQENGSASERVINSFLNPANTSKNRKTEIDDELLRLHEATKDLDVGAKVLPSRPARSTKVDDVRLSPDEYYDYAKTKGNLSLGLVTDFAKSERYKSLDDAEKAQVVSDLYTFAADQAADEIRRQRGAEFKNKMAKEEELAKKGQLTDYFLFKTAYKERAKAEDYEGIGKLMDDYDSLPKAVKESLGDDVEALNDSGLEPKAFFNVESLKKEYSKGGAFKRVSQIMSSGISAEEQKYVAESILGDNQLRQYNAAVSKLGMTPFEAVDFLLNANTGTDSQTSKTEAKEAARGTKKYSDAVIEAFLNAAYGE